MASTEPFNFQPVTEYETGIIRNIDGRKLTIQAGESYRCVTAKYRKHSYQVGQRVTIRQTNGFWRL